MELVGICLFLCIFCGKGALGEVRAKLHKSINTYINASTIESWTCAYFTPSPIQTHIFAHTQIKIPSYMRLIVVLEGHGDDVDADDEGDDEVQVVVCAQCVDHQAHVAIAGIVGQLLGLCWKKIY